MMQCETNIQTVYCYLVLESDYGSESEVTNLL